MATKPEEINWGGAVTPAPSSTKRTLGWLFLDPPPFSFVNWFWNLASLWLQHLSGAGTYTNLADAVLNLTAVGGGATERTFLLDEKDTDQAFGSTNLTTTAPTIPLSIAVTGRSIIRIGSGAADAGVGLQRDLSTAIATYAKSASIVATRIISDGVFVAIAYGDFVELFNHDTGASIWLYDHGGLVHDIAMDGTHIYMVGANGTTSPANKKVRALPIAASGVPVEVWSYDHGATVFSVATNGRQVFIAGSASSFSSAATLRALNAVNVNDFDNEGGTATDGTLSAWNITQAVPVASQAKLATDGRSLWIALPAAAIVDIERPELPQENSGTRSTTAARARHDARTGEAPRTCTTGRWPSRRRI